MVVVEIDGMIHWEIRVEGNEFLKCSIQKSKTPFNTQLHPQKTNMTMEKQPFEDVSSPIKNGDARLSCLFSGGI